MVCRGLTEARMARAHNHLRYWLTSAGSSARVPRIGSGRIATAKVRRSGRERRSKAASERPAEARVCQRLTESDGLAFGVSI